MRLNGLQKRASLSAHILERMCGNGVVATNQSPDAGPQSAPWDAGLGGSSGTGSLDHFAPSSGAVRGTTSDGERSGAISPCWIRSPREVAAEDSRCTRAVHAGLTTPTTANAHVGGLSASGTAYYHRRENSEKDGLPKVRT